jgi:hypothetical protein
MTFNAQSDLTRRDFLKIAAIGSAIAAGGYSLYDGQLIPVADFEQIQTLSLEPV